MKFDFAIVGCLVEHEGKFLLVKESKPGREGLYNVPSGHIDNDETLAQAAVREVLEESGYHIELTGFLGFYQSIYPENHLNVGGVVFAAKVIGGDATPSEVHPEVSWFSPQELMQLSQDGMVWTQYPPIALEDYLRRGVYPLDTVSSQRY